MGKPLYSVPGNPHSHLEKDHSITCMVEEFPYREAVRSLLFAAICTRPDISVAVGLVAKFASKPNRSR